MIPSHNINKKLKEAGIPPVLNFIKPYNTLNEQLEELNKTIQKNIISIQLTSILMLILIYEYIFFYFKKSIMKISVLKIHGISFFKRYQEYIMLESICYVLLLLLSLFIHTIHPISDHYDIDGRLASLFTSHLCLRKDQGNFLS